MSVASEGMGGNPRYLGSNPINIARRGKHYLDELKQGYQGKLPNIRNMKHPDYQRRNGPQSMLPPLVSGQSMGINSLSSNNYQYNGRPPKLRSINNKQYLGPGVNGERMRLLHNASQEKLSGYSQNYGSPNKEQQEPSEAYQGMRK